MRRISFALTTDAVLARTKTVTRRLGWKFAKVGDRYLAVDKLRTSSARKLAVIEVVDIRVEPLQAIEDLDYHSEGRAEVRREGGMPAGRERCGACKGEFSDCPSCFVWMFMRAMKVSRLDTVRRIEFRYPCRYCDQSLLPVDDVTPLTDGTLAHASCNADAFEAGAYV